MTKEDVEFVLRVTGDIYKNVYRKITAEDILFSNIDGGRLAIKRIYDNLADAKEACENFNKMCDIFEKPEEKCTVYYFINMNHTYTYRCIKISRAEENYKKCIDENGYVNGDLD